MFHTCQILKEVPIITNIYKYYSILYAEAKNKHFLKGHDDLPLDDKQRTDDQVSQIFKRLVLIKTNTEITEEY